MMLKFFFWVLLLANAGLLAYQQGVFDTMLPSGREPARMGRQINADKLRLIPPPDVKTNAALQPAAPPPSEPAPPPGQPQTAQPTPDAAPAAPAPAAPEKTTASERAPATTPVAVNQSETASCVEIGNFNPEEARRFAALLAPLALGDRVARRPVQEVASHMVFIPPLGDKEGAEKKAGELRRLGIEDFFVIQDNSALRWGISLGVFKQEEAARAHLASLAQKGVRSARIGQRTVTSSQVAFQVRGLDADGKAALDRIGTGFPRQEMHKCG